ncbi:hypothetical protein [Proteiniclasticum ruminis]|uniref:hypothetical protein n=1 Tax=Proteiniclasticum ruminis TaxID=398199 RepID=UPI001160C655|nr:hypothetical protein [Proteiniclasticum ruminis]
MLMVGLTFTEERAVLKVKQMEMEALLDFDYKLEGYYLLLLSGGLMVDEGVSYGSLEEYEVSEKPQGEFVIEFQKDTERVEIVGYYGGKERQRYEFRNQTGDGTE